MANREQPYDPYIPNGSNGPYVPSGTGINTEEIQKVSTNACILYTKQSCIAGHQRSPNGVGATPDCSLPASAEVVDQDNTGL